MVDLRLAAESDPEFPPVLFVHMGDPRQGDEFFAQYHPDARAVSDPEARLYEAFGLHRGGLRDLFHPALLTCGIRAARKGHTPGKPVGDPWRKPGYFLVQADRILRAHRAEHMADHPDYPAFATPPESNR